MAPSGNMAPPEISAIWCCDLFDNYRYFYLCTCAGSNRTNTMETVNVKLILCPVEEHIFHPHPVFEPGIEKGETHVSPS